MDLFDRAAAADPSGKPLAERVRPRRLEDFAGQEHVLGPGAALRGVKEIREIVQAARDRRKMNRKRTILFVDEIHRFTKAQQDAFLPHVEDGTITLIGATTENPSFEVNAALLSRCRVVTLRGLTEEEVGA